MCAVQNTAFHPAVICPQVINISPGTFGTPNDVKKTLFGALLHRYEQIGRRLDLLLDGEIFEFLRDEE
jgi:hypothetical protein